MLTNVSIPANKRDIFNIFAAIEPTLIQHFSMRTVSRLFFLALLLLTISTLSAQQQNSSRDFKIGITGHYGFLIAHHSTMQYLVKGHIGGFELTWSKPTFGEQEWQRVYNFPEWGVSYLHMELANPEVLGNLHGVFGYFNFPKGKKKRTNFRMGFGVAYLTQHFDRVENHKNIAIGSHLNGLVNLGYNRHFTLSKHLLLETGIYLTHASNGSSKVPNLGINMPTINLGLTYDLSDGTRQRIHDSIRPIDEKPRFVAVATAGFNEIEPVGGKKYLVTEWSGNMSWPLSHRWHAVGGLDIIYNSSNIEKLHRDTVSISSNFENVQAGFKAGGEMFIGKISVPLEMGVYLHTKMKRNGLLYHRMGVRYNFNEHWFGNFTLKTHFAKADYFAWGAGYRF
jgi:hypothetical protein